MATIVIVAAIAVVVGCRVVGYCDIAFVCGVDATHNRTEQGPVMRRIGQIVQVDKKMYHLVYDSVFGLGEREIVRGAETEVEVIVGMSPLSVHTAITWRAFAYEGACRAQSKRDLGQAAAEDLKVELMVSFFYEFERKIH